MYRHTYVTSTDIGTLQKLGFGGWLLWKFHTLASHHRAVLLALFIDKTSDPTHPISIANDNDTLNKPLLVWNIHTRKHPSPSTTETNYSTFWREKRRKFYFTFDERRQQKFCKQDWQAWLSKPSSAQHWEPSRQTSFRARITILSEGFFSLFYLFSRKNIGKGSNGPNQTKTQNPISNNGEESTTIAKNKTKQKTN